ncbi:hypothetical protein ESCO_001397 [Escovopsis weberi]|uniref:Uncharacterized protein n=1 Tax=Escovopsis weberi TaxID=150374 RepID=A0A0M8N2I8_ESCWE|nr:hypothetical protein ESCO_001397 [Escovopsis weberi]
MAISWDSIRGLAVFFGPLLLPKAVSYYRSIRSASSRSGLPIRPAPTNLRVAIFALSLLAFLLVCKALPPFAPENIFLQTQSRLQIPVDVLFARLAAVRERAGAGTGTPAPGAWDAALRAKFVNLENRLLYLRFGPEVLADCPFCSADDPRSYLYYAVPSILWPHIANLAVLAAATSPAWTGRHGSQWRAPAAIAAALLAAAELYLAGSYHHQLNARALRLADLDLFYWDLRAYRLLATAALDAGLALLLWLSATHRAFGHPPSPAQRVELLARAVMLSRSKLNALGIVKNTVARDEALRAKTQAYWQHEVRLMDEVMEEKDVIEGVNDALSNRIDIDTITKDAEQYAENVMRPF